MAEPLQHDLEQRVARLERDLSELRALVFKIASTPQAGLASPTSLAHPQMPPGLPTSTKKTKVIQAVPGQGAQRKLRKYTKAGWRVVGQSPTGPLGLTAYTLERDY